MPAAQRKRFATRYAAEPMCRLSQRLAQHLGMIGTGYAVSQHACPGQALLVVLQAIDYRTQRASHAASIYHCQHRQAKLHSHIGTARLAVKQAHYAFNQHHIVMHASVLQHGAASGSARHPQIKLVHALPAGKRVPACINKVGPALKHLHAQALPAPKACQRSRNRGFALPR